MLTLIQFLQRAYHSILHSASPPAPLLLLNLSPIPDSDPEAEVVISAQH